MSNSKRERRRIRLSIRAKFFLTIIGVLGAVTVASTATIKLLLESIVINETERDLVDYYHRLRGGFDPASDIQAYAREREKELGGFTTIIDRSNWIVFSTSPEFFDTESLPQPVIEEVRTHWADETDGFVLYEPLVHSVDVRMVVLHGELADGYFARIERPIDYLRLAESASSRAILIAVAVVAIFGSTLALLVAGTLARPIIAIGRKAHSIARLEFDTELHITSTDEIGDLAVVMNSIADELKETWSRLSEANRRLETLSQTDSLTGLSNRLKIDQVLEREHYRAEERGQAFAVLMCDLDKFKEINDRYGHHAGDQVLVEFADLLRRRSRQSDLVGRWGGEEFIIVLPDTDREGALAAAESLRRACEVRRFSTVGSITASIGVGIHRQGMSAENVMKHADEALYRAKELGRNRVEVYSTESET